MFVFFAAKLNGEITERTHRAAALIELLHTASLVHDDVVDDSNLRRGFFSVNALWKNKVAVLVGDYLLSKGLLLSIQHKDFDILELVAEAVEAMSEGELLQMEKARKLDITEDVYYDIIKRKTASLITAACGAGFASTGGLNVPLEQMKLFGEKTGIAFQIRDDLFDYGSAKIGKPVGIDIKEKKMTLPLIFALNKASDSTRRKIIKTIKNHNEDKQKVKEVIDFVIKSGGLEYAEQKMNDFQQEAIDILNQFPDGEGKTGLLQLISFTTERKL
ncbi:UNVERIFIED_CONTAM: hypothetical protein GTU68_036491 [Idotea baltica]|nr:hypothetical protein [Idotea baltica]